MKQKLESLSRQLRLLEAFEEKYQPGERVVVCVHSLTHGLVPHIAFYGEHDREWIVATFGADGWKGTHRSDGWQHAEKMIDGVLVGFQEAHRLEPINVIPAEISAHLLTEEPK